MSGFTFTFQPVIDAIRGHVRTAYGIPDGHAVPEAGDQPVAVDASRLPMASLRTSAVPFEDGGHNMGAQSVVWLLSVECWELRQTTADTDDVSAVREDLLSLAGLIYGDRHLLGPVGVGDPPPPRVPLADWVRVTEINWTGEGHAWPFAPSEGAGVACGYVTVEVGVAVRST